MRPTINCDMGEGFGIYRICDDEALMPHIDLANVACGFHASDPVIMRQTVKLAKKHNVKVGAHPSLPDLVGFGRRDMAVEPEELRDLVIYQVGALGALLEAEGLTLHHIKPHGALYGMTARDKTLCLALAEAVDLFGVPMLGMANTWHETVFRERKVAMLPEFYADLEYDAQGHVIATRKHVATVPGEASKRVLAALASGKVAAQNGHVIPVRAETVCVHSDTPTAVELSQMLRKSLDALEAGD